MKQVGAEMFLSKVSMNSITLVPKELYKNSNRRASNNLVCRNSESLIDL